MTIPMATSNGLINITDHWQVVLTTPPSPVRLVQLIGAFWRKAEQHRQLGHILSQSGHRQGLGGEPVDLELKLDLVHEAP